MKIRLLLLLVIFSLSFFTLTKFNDLRREELIKKEKANTAVLFEKPVYLNFEGSSRTLQLSEIGIKYDPITDAVKIDNLLLDKYFTNLEDDFRYLSKNPIISLEEYSFAAPSESNRIVLDQSSFFTKDNILELIRSNPAKIKIILNNTDTPELRIEKLNKLIDSVSSPLLIKYGRNPIYIPSDKIKSFIETREGGGLYKAYISQDKVSEYLAGLDEKYGSPEVVVVHPEAVDVIRRAILFRAADNSINNAVILPLEGKPRSQGEKADVYLEVIKSQQRLYRFEQGKLTKTYIVSTGLTWETPPGIYSIQGKQRMTISYTNDWYMPFYLPVGLINGQYRFGFHAIPYHMDGNGNIYSRDLNSMGSPATGGCIQLTSSDAEELFNWAWVGIPVYIYE